MGWITDRQTITAVSCRHFQFCCGSQSSPATWCPMEISTIVYGMGVGSCGGKKVGDCQLQKRALCRDPLPWQVASLPVHTARPMVIGQQARCFRRASDLLQVSSDIERMLPTSAHSSPPAPLRGPLRKVSTPTKNHGQDIPAATLLVLFPKHCSDQATRRHAVQTVSCCRLSKGTGWTGGMGSLRKSGVCSPDESLHLFCSLLFNHIHRQLGSSLIALGPCKWSVRDRDWGVRSVTWAQVQLVPVWMTHPSGAGCSVFSASFPASFIYLSRYISSLTTTSVWHRHRNAPMLGASVLWSNYELNKII